MKGVCKQLFENFRKLNFNLWQLLQTFPHIISTHANKLLLSNLLKAHRRMRTVTNYFLLNLSVADLLMASLNCIFNFIFMIDSGNKRKLLLWVSVRSNVIQSFNKHQTGHLVQRKYHCVVYRTKLIKVCHWTCCIALVSRYCTVNNFIANVSVSASVFTLVAISFDR